MKNYLKKKGIPLAIAVLAVLIIASVSLRALEGRAGLLSNITGAIKAPVYKVGSSIIDWLRESTATSTNMTSWLRKTSPGSACPGPGGSQARRGGQGGRRPESFESQEKRSDFVFESAKIIS